MLKCIVVDVHGMYAYLVDLGTLCDPVAKTTAERTALDAIHDLSSKKKSSREGSTHSQNIGANVARLIGSTAEERQI